MLAAILSHPCDQPLDSPHIQQVRTRLTPALQPAFDSVCQTLFLRDPQGLEILVQACLRRLADMIDPLETFRTLDQRNAVTRQGKMFELRCLIALDRIFPKARMVIGKKIYGHETDVFAQLPNNEFLFVEVKSSDEGIKGRQQQEFIRIARDHAAHLLYVVGKPGKTNYCSLLDLEAAAQSGEQEALALIAKHAFYFDGDEIAQTQRRQNAEQLFHPTSSPSRFDSASRLKIALPPQAQNNLNKLEALMTTTGKHLVMRKITKALLMEPLLAMQLLDDTHFESFKNEMLLVKANASQEGVNKMLLNFLKKESEARQV